MGTSSDQIRPAGRASKRRRGRRGLTAVWIGAIAAALACGEGGGDPQSRGELERRFGRRPAETVAEPGAGAGEPPAETPDATRAGAGEEAEPGAPGREGPPQTAAAEAPTPAAEPTGAPPPSPRRDPAAREGPATPERPTPAPVEEAPTETPAEAPPPVAGSPQEVDLDALLAGAERTYASLSSLRASFVQVMEVPLLERSSSGRGTWYQKGRDRFRMDFEDPPDDEIVADGTYLWLFQPSVQPDQVIRSTLEDGVSDSGAPDLLGRILAQARTAYRSRYEGRESVAGARTHVIALVPIARSQYREVRVWIGDDRLVRRFQILEENESRRTVTLSQLEPNVPLADSLFRFTPPPGVDVFDG